MLNLFLSFLLIVAVLYPHSAHAAESIPEICKEYIQHDSEFVSKTKPRESIPYGEGLLWKIEQENGIAPSYLFGTMHSQDRKVSSLPPEVRLAMVHGRTLVMEVVPDELAQQQFIEAIYFTGDENLSALLDKEIYQALTNIIPDYGLNVEDLSRLKPWAAFTLIGRPRPVRANTQEQVLMQAAMAANLSIAGLETMQELTAVLDGLSMQDQIIILNDTVCNHSEIIRKTRDLVDMYLARDLAGLVIFNEQAHYDEAIFDRFMQRILHDRNKRMLERIEPHLQAGGAFIAIGASHLPDEKGLLKFLENKNYKISRVY